MIMSLVSVDTFRILDLVSTEYTASLDTHMKLFSTGKIYFPFYDV